MKNNLLFYLLTFVFSLFPIQQGFCNGIDVGGIMFEIDFYETLTAKVIPYVDENYNKIPYHGDIDIPSEIVYNGKTYPVTSIGDRAFEGCSELTSVNIPNSITSIGESAFYGCTSILNLFIPRGVTTIKYNAFKNCTRIQYIDFPRGLKNLGSYSFEGCSGLLGISLNDELETIGDGAFKNCSQITSVTIPASVTYIGSNSFAYCDLHSVDLLDCKAVIKEWAFFHNINLVNVNLGKKVQTIEPAAFYACNSLTSIHIPNSVTTLGESNFIDCGKLSWVYIPNGISFIGWGTFMHCYNLETVHIPNSVTAMDGEVFRFDVEADGSFIKHQNKLKDIYMYNTVAPQLGRHNTVDELNTFRDYQYKDITIHVPYGSLGNYLSANEWRNFTNIVEMEPSTSVTIPDNGGYSTFYCEHPFKVPAGLKCGIITEENNGHLAIEYLYTEGMTVPAWTGVLLRGEPHTTYILVYDDSNKDRTPECNLLYGLWKEDKTFAPGVGNKYYKLSYEQAGGSLLGWYWGAENGNAFSMPAHKAFLALPEKTVLNATQGFSMEELGEVTGITTIVSDTLAPEIYDMNGRQINVKSIQDLRRGIYVINGKKIVIK